MFSNQFQDERLPGEILQSRESQSLFTEFQRELLDEIALERQADKLRVLLAQKEAVTPGRSFGDAKVMVEELGAFEQALPPGTALRIYEQHQEKLIQKAQHEFKELLQEHVELFVDIVVSWRARHPDLPPLIGLNGQENEAVHSILREHKRYRLLNGLPDLRSTAIGQFASFLSLPLERHCPAGSLCADLGASLLLQQHRCEIHLILFC
jgi:Rho GTPase-activating protein 5